MNSDYSRSLCSDFSVLYEIKNIQLDSWRLNKSKVQNIVKNFLMDVSSSNVIGKLLKNVYAEVKRENRNDKLITYQTEMNAKTNAFLKKLNNPKSKSILICDNFDYWDSETRNLILNIIANCSNDERFIESGIAIILTSHFSTSLCKLFNYKYSISEVTEEKIRDMFPKFDDFDSNQIKEIIHVCDGNLKTIQQVQSQLESIKTGISQSITEIIFKKILEKYEKEAQKSYQDLSKLIISAATIGYRFQEYSYRKLLRKSSLTEINIEEFITDIKRDNLKKIIQHKESNSYYFYSDIDYKYINDYVLSYEAHYHKLYSDVLSTTNPSRYIERANHLYLSCNLQESLILYAIHHILFEDNLADYIPLYDDKDLYVCLEEDEKLKEIVIFLQDARKRIENDDYLELISQYENRSNPGILKLDWVYYYYYAKALNRMGLEDYRFQAKNLLIDFVQDPSLAEQEFHLWIQSAGLLLSIFDHLNQENPKEIWDLINQQFRQRQTYDMEIEKHKSYIYTRTNTLFNPYHSRPFLKKSYNYFKQYKHKGGDYHKLMFISAMNYIGNEVIIGSHKEIINCHSELIEYFNDENYWDLFPRLYSYKNNILISEIKSCTRDLDLIKNDYLELLETTPEESTTIILIQNNYALVKFLSGDLPDSIQILEKLEMRIMSDKEIDYYYSYLVLSNLIVISALLGDYKPYEKHSEYILSISDMYFSRKSFIHRNHMISKLCEDKMNIINNGIHCFDLPFPNHFNCPSLFNSFLLFAITQYWSF